MSRRVDWAAVKIILVLLGVLIGWTAASYAYGYFIQDGVTSDFATGYCIIVFVAVLGAFGLTAFKVKRRKATLTPKTVL